MNKFMKAAAAIMLMTMVVFVAGCHKENNGENGGSDPTTEGIYLGIIGFNNQLYIKEISLLNSSTKGQFTNFIDGLDKANLTGLYYADYTALMKMKSFTKPPKLKTVALVTFTDGLDNFSTDDATTNPENYGSLQEYRQGLHNKIINELIHGKHVSAYTVGLKGDDVQDEAVFNDNLYKLASSNNNAFLVSNMNEVNQKFRQIAADLYHTSTSANISLDVPTGYDEGTQIRFTFDIGENGNPQNSNRYISATYKRTSNSRILDNITYYGLQSSSPNHLESFTKHNGFWSFAFADLQNQNGESISQSALNSVLLWKKTSNGVWEKETEFVPANSISTQEEKSSALIMLVLDCTTSLKNDFTNMKNAAKEFVNTLASSNH